MNMEIKQFPNEEDAIAEIMLQFCEGANPIIDEDGAKAFAEEIVRSIPSSMRDEYSDNVVIAAAQYAEIYKASLEKKDSGNALQTQNTGSVDATFDKKAMPKVSEAEQKVIDDIVSGMNKESKIENTINSKVTKYLYKNQPLATLLGTKMVQVHPVISANTFSNIEKNLVPDAKNEEVWKKIKELLADENSLVDAPLNDKLGRPEGAVIKNEKKGEGSNKGAEEQFNRERLISHLFFNTMMKIGSAPETNLGVKISKVEKKKIKSKVGYVERASIGITFTGQKDIKAANYDFINEPVMKKDDKGKDTFDTTDRTISTNLSVQIYVERENAEGKLEKKPSTYRIRGKYPCPKYVRKEAYAVEFPAPENRDFIENTVTAKDIEDVKASTQFLLSLAATNKIGDVEKFGSDMTEIVKKLNEAKSVKVNPESLGI